MKHDPVSGNHFQHHPQELYRNLISHEDFNNFHVNFRIYLKVADFVDFKLAGNGRKVAGTCKSACISSKLVQDVPIEVLLHLQTIYEHNIVSLSLMKKRDFYEVFQIYLKNSSKSRFSVILKS